MGLGIGENVKFCMHVNHLNIALLLFINASLNSCRQGDDLESLKWSCVDTQRPVPTASIECHKQLQDIKDPVLTYYKAVPVFKNGTIAEFKMEEKQ